MLHTLHWKAVWQFKHVPLFVDGWKVQTVESYDYIESKWEDILEKDIKEISNLDSEKYLGQICPEIQEIFKILQSLGTRE